MQSTHSLLDLYLNDSARSRLVEIQETTNVFAQLGLGIWKLGTGTWNKESRTRYRESQGQGFGNWEREHGTRNKKEGIGKVELGIRNQNQGRQEKEMGIIGRKKEEWHKKKYYKIWKVENLWQKYKCRKKWKLGILFDFLLQTSFLLPFCVCKIHNHMSHLLHAHSKP